MHEEWLIEFISNLEVAQSQSDLMAVLKALTKAQGFEHFAYVDAYNLNIRGMSDYPQEWQRQYLERHLNISDPVVTLAKKQDAPFQWSRNEMPIRLSKAEQAIMEEAASYGISAGVTIPIPASFNHRVTLTLASSAVRPDSQAFFNPTALRDAGVFLHAFAKNRGRRLLEGPDYKLTPQECRVLAWIKHGVFVEDIAEIMGLKVSGVRFHILSARRKLGAFRVQEAIGIATDQGLI